MGFAADEVLGKGRPRCRNWLQRSAPSAPILEIGSEHSPDLASMRPMFMQWNDLNSIT